MFSVLINCLCYFVFCSGKLSLFLSSAPASSLWYLYLLLRQTVFVIFIFCIAKLTLISSAPASGLCYLYLLRRQTGFGISIFCVVRQSLLSCLLRRQTVNIISIFCSGKQSLASVSSALASSLWHLYHLLWLAVSGICIICSG